MVILCSTKRYTVYRISCCASLTETWKDMKGMSPMSRAYLRAARHGLAVVQHVVHGDGQRAFVAPAALIGTFHQRLPHTVIQLYTK
jgi:hypothetical protein